MKLDFITRGVWKALSLNVGIVIRIQFSSSILNMKALNVKLCTFMCAHSIMGNPVSKKFSSKIFASKFEDVAAERQIFERQPAFLSKNVMLLWAALVNSKAYLVSCAERLDCERCSKQGP